MSCKDCRTYLAQIRDCQLCNQITKNSVEKRERLEILEMEGYGGFGSCHRCKKKKRVHFRCTNVKAKAGMRQAACKKKFCLGCAVLVLNSWEKTKEAWENQKAVMK